MADSWGHGHLKLFLRGGAVFYLRERSLTSPQPHFFVVLNHAPLTDECLLLVVSSSQVASVKRRRQGLPPETTVEVRGDEYQDFTKDSIIDCNSVFVKTKLQLLALMNSGGSQKADLPVAVLDKLRTGVLASPVIEKRVKEMLV